MDVFILSGRGSIQIILVDTEKSPIFGSHIKTMNDYGTLS
jgi:hypothetical protein